MVDNQKRRGAKVAGFRSLCRFPTKSIVILNLMEYQEPHPHHWRWWHARLAAGTSEVVAALGAGERRRRFGARERDLFKEKGSISFLS
jgi:uncharacterized protein YycO